MTRPEKLQFYASAPEACNYLPEQAAVNVFADPSIEMNSALYAQLINKGFRRSGRHVYRPICPTCSACVATRVSVESFRPSRSQRRSLIQNQGLAVSLNNPGMTVENFALYRTYLKSRHSGGGMDNPTEDTFLSFLTSTWSDTFFIEFRDTGRLVAVAVCDRVAQGLSAVYTFFDPEYSRQGLGTYAILWQIEEARRQGLAYVYLGYWIAGHQKMNYKTRFRPIEGLVDGRWQQLET